MAQMNSSKFRSISARPLSLMAAVLAVFIIIYELIQISSGHLYLETLNFIDGTTLIELSLIILWGAYTLREHTDLQAMSFTLVNALSFIFIYEAVYKWSFYLAPFRMHMPPDEFREFVIQAGTALTVLTGFADGRFTLKKWTWIWFGLFATLWVFWLLIGFPQITTSEVVFGPAIPIKFTYWMIYALNRLTKAVMFFAYLTFFPSIMKLEK